MRLHAVKLKHKKKLKSLIANPRPSKIYRHNVFEAISDEIHSEIRISDSIDNNEQATSPSLNWYDDEEEYNDDEHHGDYGDYGDVVEFSRDNSVDELEQQYENLEAHINERKRQSSTPIRKLEGDAIAQFEEAGIYKHFKSPVGGKRDEGNTRDMVMRCIRLLIWLHFTIHGEQIDLITLTIIEFFTIFVKR